MVKEKKKKEGETLLPLRNRHLHIHINENLRRSIYVFYCRIYLSNFVYIHYRLTMVRKKRSVKKKSRSRNVEKSLRLLDSKGWKKGVKVVLESPE